MSPMPRPANIPYTYDDYRTLPDDGRRYELIEGDLFVSPATAPWHQTVSRRLQYALMTLLELPGIAEVFDAPCDVILSSTTVVQPDIIMLRRDRQHLISRRAIEGVPNVVVEILSPSTAERDQYIKRAAYARFGVPEYWVVDPELGYVELHRLEGAGYRLEARFDRASTLRSPELPEVSIPLAPVFTRRDEQA
jgi:Uma2 family endonuclease